MTAPSSTVTFSPNTTYGSTTTSLPNLVSAERNTVSGAIKRDAGIERRFAQALLRNGFRFGKLALGVDAAHFVLLDFDRDRVELHAACDLDRIGQIKFALAIAVTDPFQNGDRMHAGKRHDPAIAKTDRAFVSRSVGLFANGDELLPVNDQPSVAGRIDWPEAKYGNGSSRGQRRAQPLNCRRLDQRRVAINNQNIIGMPFDRRFGRQDRMRCSAALLLHKACGVRQDALRFRLDCLLPGTNDHGRRGDTCFGNRRKHMRQQ